MTDWAARRHPRRTQPRPSTLSVKELTRNHCATIADDGDDLVARPVRRADCVDAERPCPFVACRFHLYLEVHPQTGAIKLLWPHLEPWELGETCALDVADRGGVTLEAIGMMLNVSRERVRQVEATALRRVRIAAQHARCA